MYSKSVMFHVAVNQLAISLQHYCSIIPTNEYSSSFTECRK